MYPGAKSACPKFAAKPSRKSSLSRPVLSYMYLGRNKRLTEVRGEVVKEIIT